MVFLACRAPRRYHPGRRCGCSTHSSAIAFPLRAPRGQCGEYSRSPKELPLELFCKCSTAAVAGSCRAILNVRGTIAVFFFFERTTVHHDVGSVGSLQKCIVAIALCVGWFGRHLRTACCRRASVVKMGKSITCGGASSPSADGRSDRGLSLVLEAPHRCAQCASTRTSQVVEPPRCPTPSTDRQTLP